MSEAIMNNDDLEETRLFIKNSTLQNTLPVRATRIDPKRSVVFGNFTFSEDSLYGKILRRWSSDFTRETSLMEKRIFVQRKVIVDLVQQGCKFYELPEGGSLNSRKTDLQVHDQAETSLLVPVPIADLARLEDYILYDLQKQISPEESLSLPMYEKNPQIFPIMGNTDNPAGRVAAGSTLNAGSTLDYDGNGASLQESYKDNNVHDEEDTMDTSKREETKYESLLSKLDWASFSCNHHNQISLGETDCAQSESGSWAASVESAPYNSAVNDSVLSCWFGINGRSPCDGEIADLVDLSGPLLPLEEDEASEADLSFGKAPLSLSIRSKLKDRTTHHTLPSPQVWEQTPMPKLVPVPMSIKAKGEAARLGLRKNNVTVKSCMARNLNKTGNRNRVSRRATRATAKGCSAFSLRNRNSSSSLRSGPEVTTAKPSACQSMNGIMKISRTSRFSTSQYQLVCNLQNMLGTVEQRMKIQEFRNLRLRRRLGELTRSKYLDNEGENQFFH